MKYPSLSRLERDRAGEANGDLGTEENDSLRPEPVGEFDLDSEGWAKEGRGGKRVGRFEGDEGVELRLKLNMMAGVMMCGGSSG